jgi:tryptophanyl-tRNA synthetase
LKQQLADVTIEFLRPLQERVRAIDDEELANILELGAAKARGIAGVTWADVKEKMGLSSAKRTRDGLPGEAGQHPGSAVST